MKILIRSIDKKYLLNFEMSTHVKVCSNNAIQVHFDMGSIVLGRYSTEEKAIKVIDLIEKEYGKYLTLSGRSAFVKDGMNVQPNVFNIPKVFQMPADDEL